MSTWLKLFPLVKSKSPYGIHTPCKMISLLDNALLLHTPAENEKKKKKKKKKMRLHFNKRLLATYTKKLGLRQLGI